MQEDAVETKRMDDEAGPRYSAMKMGDSTMRRRGKKGRPTMQERENQQALCTRRHCTARVRLPHHAFRWVESAEWHIRPSSGWRLVRLDHETAGVSAGLGRRPDISAKPTPLVFFNTSHIPPCTSPRCFLTLSSSSRRKAHATAAAQPSPQPHLFSL